MGILYLAYISTCFQVIQAFNLFSSAKSTIQQGLQVPGKYSLQINKKIAVNMNSHSMQAYDKVDSSLTLTVLTGKST